jgi:hypothetical protein
MNNIAEYLDQTAKIIDLPIDPEYREGVISNLERIAELAKLITEFPLNEKTEIAPVFDPSFNPLKSTNS